MSVRVGVLSSEKDQVIQKVKEAMKTNKDLRMHKRYQVILMVLHGESYEKIASITGQSRATLYNYSNAYRLKGLIGLDRGHPPGRKSFLTPEQEQRVYQMIVHQKPVDVGFPVEMNWTSHLFANGFSKNLMCPIQIEAHGRYLNALVYDLPSRHTHSKKRIPTNKKYSNSNLRT